MAAFQQALENEEGYKKEVLGSKGTLNGEKAAAAGAGGRAGEPASGRHRLGLNAE